MINLKYILSEYISNEEILLKKYFETPISVKKEYLAEEYSFLVDDFLEERDITLEYDRDNSQLEHYEVVEWMKRNSPDIFEEFCDYLYTRIVFMDLPISPSEYPAWAYFDDRVELIKNQWLIHFTRSADEIGEDGFKYGVDDMTRLGLTTHMGEFEKKFGGYNFAYTLSDFHKYGYKGYNQYKYGTEAVIFRASGIKVWHNTDNEYQVIFYGNTARTIIPITEGEDSSWSVKDIKTKNVLYEHDDLRKVVEWVFKNYNQYRKRLAY